MLQTVLAQQFSAVPRHSFYMDEPNVELILQYPATLPATHIKIGAKTYPIVGTKVRSVMIPSPEIGAQSTIQLFNNQRKVAQTVAQLTKLTPKNNAVRIDRLNGMLQVRGLPFFPVGFYTYSPVQPTLIEEEVVRGFNLISPYQKNEYTEVEERIAYLDRAAVMGMQVNYHLTALAGGGGVDEQGQKLSWEARKQLLRAEVEAVKEHPALLSYYLADEPSARKVNPDTLALLYQVVKQADPYHPVSMVFNETDLVERYANSFDIAMVDPYPVPDKPLTDVAHFVKTLNQKFALQKPIWLVPQTFGGGEWWRREPTRQELRAMVYLGLVNGATGLQAFIRQGLSAFPKSIDMWNEYGRIAREVQSLTPFFTQEEVPADVQANEPQIQLKAWLYNGELLLLVVNPENRPVNPAFTIPSTLRLGATIEVAFENRNLEAEGNIFNDWIEGYGTRAYRMKVGRSAMPSVQLNPQNLLVDGGFEAETSPLTPDAVYFEAGLARGAIAFTDSRTFVEGQKSLRMQSPAVDSGMKVVFYPTPLLAQQHYALSIYGKGNGSFKWGIRYQNENEFNLTPLWQKFVVPFQPAESYRYNPLLYLSSSGEAWFDAATLVPDPQIQKQINEEGNLVLSFSTAFPNAQIWYQLDEGERQFYQNPLVLTQRANLRVQVWQGQRFLTEWIGEINVHKAVGKKTTYLNPFNPQYPASGENAMTDGNEGDSDLKHPAWQGYFGDDAAFIIDLGEDTLVSNIKVGALQDWYSWILAPKSMQVTGILASGEAPIALGEVQVNLPQQPAAAQKVFLELPISQPVTVRYLQFNIRNQKTLPIQHPGANTKAWMFLDEVVVE